jgi:hypothetical protein
MAGYRIFKTSVSLAHLPTLMLLIGYPIFWLEMYILPSRDGITTPLAWGLFGLTALWSIVKASKTSARGLLQDFYQDFFAVSLSEKLFRCTGGLLVGLILLCVFYAWLLPPHLGQEYDALNYHLTLPRQHLILGSFRHIPWSSGDLFPLPLNFALAPYWLATPLPNKFPQFFFFLGLILVSIRLVRLWAPLTWAGAWLIVFAIVGSHNIGIQLGLAMLDLVVCYLFLAALDSFLRGQWFWGGVEFAFLFWAKSFVPIQMTVIILAIWLSVWLLRFLEFKKISWGLGEKETVFCKKQNGRSLILRSIVVFIGVSVAIAGPFILKSLYYSGTPLYPLKPGMVRIQENPQREARLLRAAEAHMQAKDGYGYGRDGIAFVKHLWLIAVPDKGVNNSFDYPVGLVYLLLGGPFLILAGGLFLRKEVSLLAFFIIIYWLTWWFGSQQTRFLYIPLVLMYILVVPFLSRPSLMLRGGLILALLLNTLSVVRAHKRDFFRSSQNLVLRERDQELLKMNQQYRQAGRKDYVYLDYHDVAFAQFPVMVTKEKLPFVMEMN